MSSLIEQIKEQGRISTPDLSSVELQEARELAQSGVVVFNRYYTDIYGSSHDPSVEYVELNKKHKKGY